MNIRKEFSKLMVLGERPGQARQTRKRIRLSNQYAASVILFSVPYFAILPALDLGNLVFLLFPTILLYALTFPLNARGRHTVSRVLIAGTSVASIVLGASVLGLESSIQYSLYSISVLPFLLFSLQERLKLLGSLAIVAVGFMGVYFLEGNPLGYPAELLPEYQTVFSLLMQFNAFVVTVGTVFLLFLENARSEERLADKGKILSDTQRDAKIGAWTLEVPSFKTYLSEAVYEIYELPVGTELPPEKGIEFYHPDDLPRLQKALEAATRDRLPYDLELRFRTAKGNRKWVRTIGRPVVEDGKVVRIRGTFQDITELKTDEIRIQLQSELISGTNDGIGWSDSNRLITFANPALQSKFGQTMKKDWLDLFSEGCRTQVSQRILDSLNSAGFWKGGVELIDRDGEVFPALQTVIAHRDPTDDQTLYSITITDLSEYRRTEKNLELLAYSSDLGTWDWDLTNNEVFFDARWCEILGYEQSEVKHHLSTWENWVHPDDLAASRMAFELYLGGQIPTYEVKYRMKHKDGHWVSIASKGKVMERNNKGEPTRFVGTHFDLSKIEALEKKTHEQEEKAQAADKLAQIGELAAGVGHEINNPLTIANGNVDRIREEMKKPSPNLELIQKALKKYDKASGRIRTIVDGLRVFSRSNNETVQKLDVAEVVSDTLVLVKEIYKKDGIALAYEIHTDQTWTEGNIGKIQQVVMNLISNARDATAGQEVREIILKLQAKGEKMLLTVRDNGTGIPKEIRNRIFDPFFTTKEVGKGTGIGLGICHKVIVAMKGEISVESEMGEYTEFRIELPVVERGEQTIIQKEEPQVFEKLSGRVLIVDDEKDISDLLEETLRKFGLEVESVRDGFTALKYIKEKTYDFVLTDLQLPRMSGAEVIAQARKFPTTQFTQFIFVTGGVNLPEEEGERLLFGADGFIPKPFSVSEVHAVLSKRSKVRKTA